MRKDSLTGKLAGVALLLPMAGCGLLAGCTVYPEQTKPSLAMTTSAEQVQRIFWSNVTAGRWNEVRALLAPNAVWRVRGQVVPTAEIVPWLKSLNVKAADVSNVTLTPAVNDMTVLSTLQIQAQRSVRTSSAGAAAPSCSGKTQTVASLAVWQQPQPTGTASKDKSYRGYLLTVEDLSPPAAEGGAAAIDACE